MKKVIFSTLILSIVLMTSLIVEPNKSNKQSSREETSDVDKKPLFGEVKIGKQIWMTENLNVDKFRNGDLIQHAKTTDEWEKAAKEGKAAWCYYDNDSINGIKYGKLYNWYAVNDPRGLLPDGWHVPSDKEWKKLVKSLGGDDIAGAKMKSKNGWKQNGNGTNESGFDGLPGGVIVPFGEFRFITQGGGWWSSSENDTEQAWFRGLDFDTSVLGRTNHSKGLGLSVRGVKD